MRIETQKKELGNLKNQFKEVKTLQDSLKEEIIKEFKEQFKKEMYKELMKAQKKKIS